jgi:hypothetical protein
MERKGKISGCCPLDTLGSESVRNSSLSFVSLARQLFLSSANLSLCVCLVNHNAIVQSSSGEKKKKKKNDMRSLQSTKNSLKELLFFLYPFSLPLSQTHTHTRAFSYALSQSHTHTLSLSSLCAEISMDSTSLTAVKGHSLRGLRLCPIWKARERLAEIRCVTL